MYFYASIKFLKRSLQQYGSDISLKHKRKLRTLYGGTVHLPTNNSYLINLSQYAISYPETKLLNRGLDFSLTKKTSSLDDKMTIEKLYIDILENQNPQTSNSRQ